MEIRVIFDKLAVDRGIQNGWGFSALADNRVLFDTGEKGPWLLNNISKMGIDINRDIERIVISHDHWDHTGGLEALLKTRAKGTPVYICPGFSDETKEKIISHGGRVVETKEFLEITADIYVTGAIAGIYKGSPMPEQALVLKTANGISVITGCAHPSILKILERVKEYLKTDRLFLVMGGFHLLEEDGRVIELIVKKFKEIGVQTVAPTHCTGTKAEEIFAKEYGADFVAVKAGGSTNL